MRPSQRKLLRLQIPTRWRLWRQIREKGPIHASFRRVPATICQAGTANLFSSRQAGQRIRRGRQVIGRQELLQLTPPFSKQILTEHPGNGHCGFPQEGHFPCPPRQRRAVRGSFDATPQIRLGTAVRERKSGPRHDQDQACRGSHRPATLQRWTRSPQYCNNMHLSFPVKGRDEDDEPTTGIAVPVFLFDVRAPG